MSTPNSIPWRERPFLQLKLASEIAGVSPASLYKAAGDERLVFVKLGGRTLVETRSFIAFTETAARWAPSDRGAAGRESRKMKALQNWRR